MTRRIAQDSNGALASIAPTAKARRTSEPPDSIWDHISTVDDSFLCRACALFELSTSEWHTVRPFRQFFELYAAGNALEYAKAKGLNQGDSIAYAARAIGVPPATLTIRLRRAGLL